MRELLIAGVRLVVTRGDITAQHVDVIVNAGQPVRGARRAQGRPVWQGGAHGEAELLAHAYGRVLDCVRDERFRVCETKDSALWRSHRSAPAPADTHWPRPQALPLRSIGGVATG